MRRWRDLSIKCHACLQRDEWGVRANVFRKPIVQFACISLQHTFHDLDSRSAQFVEAPAPDLRIRVEHGSDHGCDACLHYSIRTRCRAPLMRARFEIQIQCSTPRAFSRLLQRQYLGVLGALVGMEAFADNLTVLVEHHCAHMGIG